MKMEPAADAYMIVQDDVLFPAYAQTRAFYLAMGFRPLEELRKLWDEANPCLIMVKRLETADRGDMT